MKIDSFLYCNKYLKNKDRYLYFLSISFPKKQREILVSLFTLSFEISKIINISEELMVKLIRINWWKEQLLNLKTNENSTNLPSSNPFLEMIAHIYKKHHINIDLVISMVENVENIIEQKEIVGLSDLENYAKCHYVNIVRIILDSYLDKKYKLDDEVILTHAMISYINLIFFSINNNIYSYHFLITKDLKEINISDKNQYLENLFKSLLEMSDKYVQAINNNKLKNLPKEIKKLLNANLIISKQYQKNPKLTNHYNISTILKIIFS